MSQGIALKIHKHAHRADAVIGLQGGGTHSGAAAPPAAPQGALNVGDTLARGRYEVVARLTEQGGMSTVFRGRDARLDRAVCIKMVKETAGSERREAIERMQREAKYAAAIRHPNLLEIYEVEPDDEGRAYMVCEFIEGGTYRG